MSMTGPPTTWPKVTSLQALQNVSMKVVKGPKVLCKETPAHKAIQHGLATNKGPALAVTTKLGRPSTVDLFKVSAPASHTRNLHDVTENVKKPMSPLTVGLRNSTVHEHASDSRGVGPSDEATRGAGSFDERTRVDFPRIHAAGGRAGVDEPGQDSDAMARVLNETHTATSRKSIRGRLVWWEARAKRRGIMPYPLDHHKLKLAAGLLKSGQYRSAGQCLYTIKKAPVEQGYEWKADLDALLGDLRRSCARGLGGTRQAAPLPIGLISTTQRFSNAESPWGLEAIVVGSWWLLREVELASLRGADIRLSEGPGCGTAELTIRASKADTVAAGCTRTHACTCPLAGCPVKAARALAQGREAGERVLQNKDGRGLNKKDTVRLLKAFAVSLDHDPARIAGHSLRTTSAQQLAEAGISTEQIKVFGRWASSANMIKYARDAHIRPSVIADAFKKRQRLAPAPPKEHARKRWCTSRSGPSASG